MESPVAIIHLPASGRQSARALWFAKPAEVWQANELAGVRPALDRVDKYQKAGNYVVGMIAYEAAPAFDSALMARPPRDFPFCWFAAFDVPLAEPVSPLNPVACIRVAPPNINISQPDYERAVRCVLDHIRAGDIYQLNYTVRARVEAPGSPRALFEQLLAAAPMPHAAFLDIGPVQVLSLSPELFLRRRGNLIESRPMKGTAARRPSWVEDEAARLALACDEKNRAENVMIVDLVRNDLGRICERGSISVPELWRSERFPTVHQMTSLVRGTLRSGISLYEIFAATFPPGSVTGAPKIRSCQLISELESTPRGIYCGTIGVFLPGGDFECNVAIRTLQSLSSGNYQLGLGSGIVADSDPSQEWQECAVKGRFVLEQPRAFTLYETIRYSGSSPTRQEDSGGGGRSGSSGGSEGDFDRDSHLRFVGTEAGGQYVDLRPHLQRLQQSCQYFGWPFPVREILRQLRDLKLSLGGDPARLRADVDSAGQVEIKVSRENLAWPATGLTVMIAPERLDPEDFRLYHKTTLRPEKYEALEAAKAFGANECLFLNTRGELTEGAISNVALLMEGRWLTPAASCGLLPGVWREIQIKSGRYREAILTVNDLAHAEAVRMVNAVRGEGEVVRILNHDGSVFRVLGRETPAND